MFDKDFQSLYQITSARTYFVLMHRYDIGIDTSLVYVKIIDLFLTTAGHSKGFIKVFYIQNIQQFGFILYVGMDSG